MAAAAAGTGAAADYGPALKPAAMMPSARRRRRHAAVCKHDCCAPWRLSESASTNLAVLSRPAAWIQPAGLAGTGASESFIDGIGCTLS